MSKLAKLKASVGSTVSESVSLEAKVGPKLARPPAQAERERVRLKNDTFDVPVSAISPDPGQPRTRMDPEKLQGLAASLKELGQLQALEVRHGEGKGDYVIVCGERRWRAAQLAGLAMLTCKVLTGAELTTRLARQMVENIQREEMDVVDQADGMARLRDEHKWSTREMADKLGISQPAVTRGLQLAGLTGAVKERVRDKKLPASSAVLLHRLSPDEQDSACWQAIEEDMTRDQVDAMVRSRMGEAPKPAPAVNHGDSPASATAPAASLGGAQGTKPGAVAELPAPAREVVTRSTPTGPRSTPAATNHFREEEYFDEKGAGLILIAPAGAADQRLKQFDKLVKAFRRQLQRAVQFDPGTRVRVTWEGSHWHGWLGHVVRPANESDHVWCKIAAPNGQGGGEKCMPVDRLTSLGKGEGRGVSK